MAWDRLSKMGGGRMASAGEVTGGRDQVTCGLEFCLKKKLSGCFVKNKKGAKWWKKKRNGR
jgi:hypothetical protein